jgi:nicotinate-nucleotide pyrophosphorylase (carboxylating)
MNPYEHPDVDAIIAMALKEDLADVGDITCRTLVADDARIEAVVTAKSPGVVCGLPLFEKIFRALAFSAHIDVCAADGTAVKTGDRVFRCVGEATGILIAERTALNLCQRLSGTATMTRQLVDAVAGTRARILDTRKTSPGLRHLQKHAVVCGGGMNHRYGLFDQVLIKENHIALMGQGGPAEAVRRCRAQLPPGTIVEVEIERLDDLEPVIAAGADIVLLDNMSAEQLRDAVKIRNARTVQLEASGGITAANIRAVAETGVDRISIGAITHSVIALDLSLRCTVARSEPR